MNNKLFNSLNNADDKYIIEAVEDFPELCVEKKRGLLGVLKYALPCAACAAVLFTGIAIGREHINSYTPNSAQPEISDSSAGIVTCEPLELPQRDTATFWEGELPVLPVKNAASGFFENTDKETLLDLDRERGTSWKALDAERGEAVYAVADGEVTFVGALSMTRGCSVVIGHNDSLYTCYNILDVDCGIPVKAGDKVTAGQVIGYAGIPFNYPFNLGDDPGITYEVWADDPLKYIGTRSDELEKWLDSGLVAPLDNIGDDFAFDNISALVSRNEKITPAPYGAQVYAVSPGLVIFADDYDNGCGLVIEILHDDGIESIYYHLDNDLPHVNKGDRVSAGDTIGRVSDNSFSGVSGLGYCIDRIDPQPILDAFQAS